MYIYIEVFQIKFHFVLALFRLCYEDDKIQELP
jgi:hypothetical protein